MREPLKDKIALVTGASRGIGRSIALALAAEGAQVALVARSQAALERVRREIVDAGGMATALPTDVAEEPEVKAALARVAEEHGRLDLLVNCAGIGVFKPLAETSWAEWQQVMAVNAGGAFLMCREAMALMTPQRSGCIINIASVVGVRGYVNQGAYSASKHALMGMTKVLAQEAQPSGVRVHVVCPGGVDTDLVAQARPDLDRTVLMQPEEIAEIVVWLASQSGSAMVDQINVRRAASAPWIE